MKLPQRRTGRCGRCEQVKAGPWFHLIFGSHDPKAKPTHVGPYCEVCILPVLDHIHERRPDLPIESLVEPEVARRWREQRHD